MSFRAFFLGIVLSLGLVVSSFASEDEVVQLKIETTAGELPQEILDLDDKAWMESPGSPYEIQLIFLNDNIKGSDRDGDDYGHTHGMRIVGATRTKEGINLKVAYSTDLYTKKAGYQVNGYGPQNITDENLMRLIVNNIDQDKVWFWEAQIGWQQLSSLDSDNIFYASEQQEMAHKFLKKYQKISVPVTVPDGRGRVDGVMGDVAIGLQKNVDIGKVNLNATGLVGSRQSSLKDVDYNYFETSLAAAYSFSKSFRLSMEVESKIKKHELGTEYSYSFDTSLEMKRLELGAAVTFYDGEVENYVLYNLPSRKDGKIDPMYMLYGKYHFGDRTKNKMISVKDWRR